MNGSDWLEITILLQDNFTSVFSFGGAALETPRQGGLHKVPAAPPGPPMAAINLQAALLPHLRYRGPMLWYKVNKIIKLHTQH